MLALSDPVIARDISDHVPSSPLSELAEQDVMITGATGMLASYLIAGIAQLRLRLGVKGRLTYAASRMYSGEPALSPGKDAVRFIGLDLAEDAIAGSEQCVVIHAASPASPRQYIDDPLGCMDVNTERTRTLLKATREAQGTFIFLSSGEVYGSAPPVPTAEHQYAALDHTQPRTIYAEAKRAGEALVLAAHRTDGVDVRIARLFHTFGPGVDLSDGRIFGGLVKAAVEDRDFKLRSSGQAYRAFLYSYDLLEGLAHLYARLDSGAIANVASSEGVMIREVASLALSAMAQDRLSVLTGPLEPDEKDLPESPIMSNISDNSLLRATGWRPQFSLEEAFKRTYESALWRREHSKMPDSP